MVSHSDTSDIVRDTFAKPVFEASRVTVCSRMQHVSNPAFLFIASMLEANEVNACQQYIKMSILLEVIKCSKATS